MNQLKRRLAGIVLVRAIAMAAAATFVVTVVAATPAEASRESDRQEQYRYANETMALPWEQYLARATDFRSQGCWNWNEPAACNKPLPYNWFTWTTDGCSWTPADLKRRFYGPCEQHDFGYRNFGKNLELERTENRRYEIDVRFHQEMYRVCAPLRSARGCKIEATAMYKIVRRFNDWQD